MKASKNASAIKAIGAETMAKANAIFNAMKMLRIRITNVDETTVDNSYDVHIKGLLDKLDSRLIALSDSQQLQQAEVLMAKYGLYDATFQQIVLLCQNISPVLGENLRDLRALQGALMSEVQVIVGGFVKEEERLTGEIHVLSNTSGRDIEHLRREVAKLKDTVRSLDTEADDHQKIILDLRSRLEASQNEIIYLKDKFEGGSNTRKLTGTKRDISNNPGYRLNSPSRPRSSAHSTSSSAGATPFYLVDNWLVNFRFEIQKCIDEGRVRVIALHECREQLERLWESKAAANAKALRVLDASSSASKAFQSSYGVPVLTMEEHFYHSFERKFGLRNIAVEQAARLLHAVQYYAKEDFLSKVFLLILRNELNEEFWTVQRDLARSVRDLLAVRVMNRSPDISKAALAEELDAKMDGVISEGEWVYIVNYLYNNTDSTMINTSLKRRARREMNGGVDDEPAPPKPALAPRTPLKPAVRGGKKTPEPEKKEHIVLRLPFTVFQSTLQDFQLRSQLMYLERFHKAFAYCDKDGDGILKPDELAACLLLLRKEGGGKFSQGAPDDAALAREADPLGSGRITFTMAATNLSKLFV